MLEYLISTISSVFDPTGGFSAAIDSYFGFNSGNPALDREVERAMKGPALDILLVFILGVAVGYIIAPYVGFDLFGTSPTSGDTPIVKDTPIESEKKLN